jgi:shikimate kinase
MKNKLVLGLTGHPGTGKSTLCDYMAEKHDFLVLEGSVLLKKYAGEQGVKLATRESYMDFFRQQQHTLGFSWLSDITFAASHNRVLQGGLRSKYDFKQIKERGGFIVALTCSPEVALERIDTSNPKNPQTIEQYNQHKLLDESPDEYGAHTSWCIENADYHLDTAKPLTETHLEVDELMAELTN